VELDTANADNSAMVEHVQERLARWVRASCSSEDGCSVETPFAVLEVLPLEEGAGHITVGMSGLIYKGVRTAVICVAVQRSSETAPNLEGAVMHWACEKEPGGNWYPPPDGWRTDPDWSVDAGGGAWQTALRPETVTNHPRRAHCLLLQIPLEGPLQKNTAGLPFVLKTADGRWLKNAATASDFFINLGLLRQKDLPTGDTYVPATHGDVSDSLEEASQDSAPPAGNSMVDLFGVKIGLPMPQLPVAPVPHRIDIEQLPQRMGGGIEGTGSKVATWVVDLVAGSEDKAERSLMHRFQIAHTILSRILEDDGASGEGMLVLASWLRFSAARHLTWNRNYNVKPREISAAQDLLTKRCAEEIMAREDLWELLRMTLVAVGRGGQGDVGQRIRDEILTVQSKNNAKGGMMEEWHQKLHNNTSPDDVVICEALLAYLKSDLNIDEYWNALAASGITRERLASFDRAIRSEPNFSQGQVSGLVEDLTNYLHTLKAVHCGDDLKSAAAAVLGYSQEGRKGRSVNMPPIEGVATPELRDALIYMLQPADKQEGAGGDPLSALTAKLGAVMEARRLLAPHMQPNSAVADRSRLRDILFLDLALESAARSYVEASMEHLSATEGMGGLQTVWGVACLMLEGCCLSLGSNNEMRMCLKECLAIQDGFAASPSNMAMRIQAAVERLKVHLALRAQETCSRMQPSAQCLGERLGVPDHALSLFSEEVVRAGPIAPTAQLVAVLERLVRVVTDAGPWQVVAPGNSRAVGQLVVVGHLKEVQHDTYGTPTVLLARMMGGEEEIPTGVVALITESATDVLCHASIRARNNRVVMVSCFDSDKVREICDAEGQWASVDARPGAQVHVEIGVEPPAASAAAEEQPAEAPEPGEAPEAEAQAKSEAGAEVAAAPGAVAAAEAPTSAAAVPGVEVAEKAWTGKWALPSSAFTPEVVGAKALNVEALRGKLPPWVSLPTSAAIPYGTFEEVLGKQPHSSAARRIEAVVDAVAEGDATALAPVRLAIKQLRPDQEVKRELEACFQGIGAVWEEEEWPDMWQCITEVWASQWNNRVVLAFAKAGVPHAKLRMSVLCQPLLPAKYAFVAHTANPLTEDPSEVYIEMVKGLGETLVGNYAGAALRATAAKAAALPTPDALPDASPAQLVASTQLLALPSKSVFLTAPSGSVMFRSDSNCEDLDGFAGAGFFDSVPLHTPEQVFADYTEEPLVTDPEFQQRTLLDVAAAAVAVEVALGGAPQDVEGVVLEDGTVYVVQSRPQV